MSVFLCFIPLDHRELPTAQIMDLVLKNKTPGLKTGGNPIRRRLIEVQPMVETVIQRST